VAGRNEVLLKGLVWRLQLTRIGANKGKLYKVDLSSMAEVERFTDQVIRDTKDTGGIDYLILTAGGPPTGHWRGPTSEVILLKSKLTKGLERAFAGQCMARYLGSMRK
jgi:NAD(P)-dependent dehydrogenase (short-subunit alcohol dehydrogenase family)